MCGIAGFYDIGSRYGFNRQVLVDMADAIYHRGPDEYSYLQDDNVALAIRRLSIIDVAHGQQPFYNKDRSVVLVCNGEIYNYKELREELVKKGYAFRTNCDVEVIVHLYDAYGLGLLDKLNGQFAFALYDNKERRMLLARDQFGICPLFYAIKDNVFVFGSEIKALLKHPLVGKEVDLTGLDQVFSFPGLVSPTTMFRDVKSLKPGHFILISGDQIRIEEYWDLNYPEEPHDYGNKPESYYADQLEDQLVKSVQYRLNADVPVGFYLSGGLDSSLIAALMKKIRPEVSYESFSVRFPNTQDKEHDEQHYQRLMSSHVDSVHNEIEFYWSSVSEKLKKTIYHSECPLKETYNTCSLALSEAVNKRNIKVVLSGEGADELLGGYVGYRFDKQRKQMPAAGNDLNKLLEDQARKKLWGDPDFFYEHNHVEFKETKKAIFSQKVTEGYHEFDCYEKLEVNKERLNGRHVFHKRSYLDLKLRLSDHLIADHCDRVTYANSVEGRYPFLDVNLLDCIRSIPPDIKLKGLIEKYILKEVARKYLPEQIIKRQKFSFVAPGSPQLLRNNIEWINDLMSYDRIRRQGYFNPDTIERLRKMYTRDNFKLNLPFDNDLLIVVVTFNIFLEVFDLPDF